MQIKALNFTGEVPNSQHHIAAHLQGALSQSTEANLAKELQLLTHGNQLPIQNVTTNLYCIIKHFDGLIENKIKRKNKGLRPQFFPFSNSLKFKNGILLPLCGIVCYNKVY